MICDWLHAILLVLVLAAAGGGGADAATFTLAGDSVEFQPPEGYCFLDRSDPRLRPMFDQSDRLQQQSGNRLLAVFIFCDELSLIRQAKVSAPAHYGLLVTVLQDGAVKPIANATRFDLFVALRRTPSSDRMDDAVSGADAALKQEGIAATRLSRPTLAGEDQFALYSSSVMELGGEGAGGTMGVYAMTLVRQYFFAIYLYGPAQEPRSRETLLAAQHSLLAQFVGLNETAKEQARQARTGQSFLGIDWDRVLVKGVAGGVAGGIMALLIALARRLRRKKG